MIESAIAMSYEGMRAFIRHARAGLPEHVRVVSIIDPDEAPLFESETDRILLFTFDDVTPEAFHGVVMPDYVLFSQDDARRVAAALQRWHDEPVAVRLVVNCMAGLSRSAAVCEYARRVFDLDADRFERDNPLRFPNPHVLRLLMREYHQIGDEG